LRSWWAPIASGSAGLSGANAGNWAITAFGSLSLGTGAATNYILTRASGSVTITQAVSPVGITSSTQTNGYHDSVTFTATLPTLATGSVNFLTNGAALSKSVSVISTYFNARQT